MPTVPRQHITRWERCLL